MNKIVKLARRRSGLATFERNCRCTTELGKKRKSCFVPGTLENGRWFILYRHCNDLIQNYKLCDKLGVKY
jgi:hypothetical protein